MVSKFTDQSSGATGAKSFGSGSQATNYGQVFQGLSPEDRSSVQADLQELRQLVLEVAHPNAEARDEVANDIAELAVEVVKEEPDSAAVGSTWNRVRGWIGGAITASLFLTKQAERVRSIIERLVAVFG